ncbi:hypothetical protein [Lacinutrix algicola]|uniref:hypothetical protein n=1 Tax=Lacinutrix algicola TaxID=342954 RepID=UPI00128FBEF6|nr:hypothetical protein [Lacinutrix algicola]
MSKRKLLKNIASGIINSFISRNNDVYGYWGIGKLYSLMVLSKSMEVEINLIDKIIKPKNKELKLLVNIYSKYLFSQIKKQGIKEEYLSKATIEIKGYPNKPILALGRLAPHRIRCKIIIENDLGKKYSLERNVWCREHNPKLESKSTRNYEN